METLNVPLIREWVGRLDRQEDQVTLAPVRKLWAVLGRDGDFPIRGDELPPLWHWLYFTPVARHDQLGLDGHPIRGGFLPPVNLPRRMWAGGNVEFHRPLRVGDEVTRVSRITDISVKEGHSGPLVFLTITHELKTTRGLAIKEVQNIVYCSASPPSRSTNAPFSYTFSREITPDPVLLFRYSALTFNAHRIHYDRAYAINAEGYPGLVVHGPLIAQLLVDLLHRYKANAILRRCVFKAVRPLFDTHQFLLCGATEGDHAFTLWARDHEGSLAMQAGAETD
jgi:3-methylfumaryl-CoA hydratase